MLRIQMSFSPNNHFGATSSLDVSSDLRSHSAKMCPFFTLGILPSVVSEGKEIIQEKKKKKKKKKTRTVDHETRLFDTLLQLLQKKISRTNALLTTDCFRFYNDIGGAPATLCWKNPQHADCIALVSSPQNPSDRRSTLIFE
ncbi:hypothetical protein CEXT_728031 [Caerostris extrusa]|uniref:Uncharacterized protein n=1 Tax=Caerostris extrusa TaxID=172846 RepID=A0AAV4SS23_CAEEX|nr:hypothetical protein CEXT_728031 [Caerostris extrusa]